MKQKKNIYDSITTKIIDSLKNGLVPWVRPWKVSQNGVYRNAVTNRPYRGMNTLLLNMVAMDKGFVDPRWLTFRNAEKLGGHVKKGEKGVGIIFWNFIPAKQDGSCETETCADDKKIIPLARMYTVFNVEQCNDLGIPALEQHEFEERHFDDTAYHDSETVLTLASIRHGGNEAYYSKSKDFISIPAKNSFESLEFYYSTALHEIVHWSGHPTRLHRKFGNRFGDQDYAFEELVAEIGSAFVGVHTGLSYEGMRHTEYISSWLQILKKDNRAIFTAAAQAQTAADYILVKAELSASEENQLPAAA